MTKRLGILALALAATAACTHPRTPEGHEGYVYYKPLIFGKAEYRETLRGPTSTGVSWRLYVKNVDMRVKSYNEDFKLLTADNLSIAFEVNTRISLRPGSVKEIVEEWGEGDWYNWNVKERLRTIVRLQVTQVSAVEIQLKTEGVRAKIENALHEKFENTPIKIESVDIGNIQFPPKVTQAIEQKIGQQQELERQEYLLAETQKAAAIRVLEALKAAKQQMIISSTLDPLYLQRMAVEVYSQLAKSNNKTVLMLPNTNKGTGMPLVMSTGRRKPLTPADEKMLEEMETRYLEIARTKNIEGSPRPVPKPTDEAPTDAPAEPAPAKPKAAKPAPAPTKPAPATP